MSPTSVHGPLGRLRRSQRYSVIGQSGRRRVVLVNCHEEWARAAVHPAAGRRTGLVTKLATGTRHGSGGGGGGSGTPDHDHAVDGERGFRGELDRPAQDRLGQWRDQGELTFEPHRHEVAEVVVAVSSASPAFSLVNVGSG